MTIAFVFRSSYAGELPSSTVESDVDKQLLAVESKVSIKILNVLGQVIAELTNGFETAGYKSVDWEATNFASGIYSYRLEAVDVANPSNIFVQTKKMILIR